LVPADSPPSDLVERVAFIHREIFQLGVLILVAIAAFLLTRAVAASNRDMSLRDASEWYRRGQQAVEAGKVDDAIDALRRAAVKNPEDRRFVLALAQALALKRDDDAARSVLLTLRESAPEDPDINLQLARLATARQDVTEALRFYHSALYAPWPADQVGTRRRVRIELIGFLLTHNQSSRALSELLALNTDLPDDVSLRIEVGRLFAQAGDNGHALDQFQRTLRLDPENRDAVAGAGRSAFQLGDYPLAKSYLRRLPADDDEMKTTRDVVDLVLSSDPLASRLGSAERRRRLVAAFSYAQRRWSTCLEERSDGQTDDLALLRETDAFERRLKRPGIMEQDTIEAGASLIDRIARMVTERCGVPTAFDRALVLIARRHGATVG
jgi:Flp pilus assembly protein TadD